MIKMLVLVIALFALISCNTQHKDKIIDETKYNQPNGVFAVNHSFSNTTEVNTTHIDLDLIVNFEKKVIRGVARHTMRNSGVKQAIFDIKNIEIDSVTLGSQGNEVLTTYNIGDFDEVLGSPLIVDIKENDSFVNIYYATTDKSEALGWMDAALTEDKTHPFLYTQGEAILTRTWIPVQDVPVNRITYTADVQVPKGLLALMSAENPFEKNESGKYHFVMDQAIPSYLIALAVGELEFYGLSENSGIYAEPGILKLAKEEFKDIPDLIEAAESLYGTYPWGRYDVLFLPYSFPFGGMENPRLTFATPTIIAGDGSLTSLIAHELAHSWSGNLVTMANWDDFWLNEGFTVYFESRIMEAVKGKEIADMITLIDSQELNQTIKRLYAEGRAEDTRLKLDLTGRDPDDGMSDVAYNKGAFFLMTLEKTVGRVQFDKFLKSYFNAHKFQSITTEQFVTYLNQNLIEKYAADFNAEEWIYGEGIPDNIIEFNSEILSRVQNLAKSIKEGADLPKDLKRTDKTTQEWIAFIRAFEGELAVNKMKEIDQQLNFSHSKNSEIMAEWYVLGIQNDYLEIRPQIEAFLLKVGRRKFLEPLYEALRDHSEESKKWGVEVYKKARPHYHAIAYLTVDEILSLKF